MTFYEKYFPFFIRNAKELEFRSYDKEGRALLEYTAQFEELAEKPISLYLFSLKSKSSRNGNQGYILLMASEVNLEQDPDDARIP